jgi:hypothetical protein
MQWQNGDETCKVSCGLYFIICTISWHFLQGRSSYYQTFFVLPHPHQNISFVCHVLYLFVYLLMLGFSSVLLLNISIHNYPTGIRLLSTPYYCNQSLHQSINFWGFLSSSTQILGYRRDWTTSTSSQTLSNSFTRRNTVWLLTASLNNPQKWSNQLLEQ